MAAKVIARRLSRVRQRGGGGAATSKKTPPRARFGTVRRGVVRRGEGEGRRNGVDGLARSRGCRTRGARRPSPARAVVVRDLAEFDEHAAGVRAVRRGSEGITSHPKLAVRPWRPPGMETAPALRGRRRGPTSWGTWHSGRRCRRASPSLPRARGHLPRTRRRQRAVRTPRVSESRANGSPVPKRPKRKFRKTRTPTRLRSSG